MSGSSSTTSLLRYIWLGWFFWEKRLRRSSLSLGMMKEPRYSFVRSVWLAISSRLRHCPQYSSISRRILSKGILEGFLLSEVSMPDWDLPIGPSELPILDRELSIFSPEVPILG